MERILKYVAADKDAGVSVSGFLKKEGFSSQNLINLKKIPESVLINGVWSYMNQKLQVGDELTIVIKEEESSEKIPPVELPLSIVYEDEDLLIINKPSDMPIHPSLNNYENSMANAVAWYYAKQKVPFVFRCINRLDRDTSGLTIVAKHMVSAGILSSMVAAKTIYQGETENVPIIEREYLAIVKGIPEQKEGRICAPIARKEGSILEREVNFETGEYAATNYKVIAEKNGYSLISLKLETGRTHQIRVHMKYLGYPLIGDTLYNPDVTMINRQALHSYKLRFLHPITHEPMEFCAPLPKDMEKLFPDFIVL